MFKNAKDKLLLFKHLHSVLFQFHILEIVDQSSSAEDWLTDWMIDWLTDWLDDWMTGWLIFRDSLIVELNVIGGGLLDHHSALFIDQQPVK